MVIRTVNYTPRWAAKNDSITWRDVAAFIIGGVLLIACLYALREGVYRIAPAALAPYATAAAYCCVAWIYAFGRMDLRFATVALWASLMGIAILYLLLTSS